jgi:hypothetical protein
MSAKHGKKHPKSTASSPAPAASNPAATPGSMADVPATAAAGAAGENVAWIDSNDPKRRLIAKWVLVGVWIYVAALWLLALDQTFNWGIFGPKMPPIP